MSPFCARKHEHMAAGRHRVGGRKRELHCWERKRVQVQPVKIIIKASSGLSNSEKLCVLVQEMKRDHKEICLLKGGRWNKYYKM